MPPLRFARMDPAAKIPTRKHLTDAGVDVYANETVTVPPFSAARVRTGVTFDVRPDFMLLAKPKSGSDFLLGAGVIDPGYQGEILIKVVNYSSQPAGLAPGGSAGAARAGCHPHGPTRRGPVGRSPRAAIRPRRGRRHCSADLRDNTPKG